MYSMSVAGGLTDDRARLCSFTHSSMNFKSVIAGSEIERTPESRIMQAHSNLSTALAMLQISKMKQAKAVMLWFVVNRFDICQAAAGNYTLKRKTMCLHHLRNQNMFRMVHVYMHTESAELR